LIAQGAVGTEDGLLRAEATKWNVNTGEQVETLLEFELDTAFQFNFYAYYIYPVIAFSSSFTQAAFSFNSRAVSLSDGTQVLWVENEIVRQIRWSPDDTRLAVVSGTAEIYQIETFDVASGDLINTIQGPDYSVGDMQWNADSSQLAVSSVWNAFSPSANVRVYTINPGNDYFASDDEDRAWGFEMDTGAAIAWHPRENMLAIASPAAIEVFSMSSEEAIVSIPVEGVSELDWSPDGERIADALPDGTIQIWEVPIS
jgi:WD40 repeat protein